MPAPTQEDIDYLVANPDVAADFEAHFQVPAKNYLGRQKQKPTEADITYLQKNPQVRPDFEAKFGDASKYLTQDSNLQPSLQPKTRLQRILDEQKDQGFLERNAGLQIPRRLGAAILDVGQSLLTPSNWKSAIKETGDTLSDIPEAITHPGEAMRGLAQGALKAPAAMNDLALMGVDKLAQVGLGNQPLPADARHPLGVDTAGKMLDDWGNKAVGALTGYEPFDNTEPTDPASKLARHMGEFVGGGLLLGGPKAVIPSAGAAIGAETAAKVAPDDPGWQVAGGVLGAFAPGVISRGVRGTIDTAQAAPEAAMAAGETVQRPFTDKGREATVGNALYEAAGRRIPDIEDQPAVPGLAPTLGQVTGNEGILALEKTMAKSQEGVLPFKERLQENQAAAREAVTNLRGSGVPEDVRTYADRALQVADETANRAERNASSGLSDVQASDLARERITGARENMRSQRRSLWNSPDLLGEDALVNVDDLRKQMADFMASRTRSQGRVIPKEIEEKLYPLADREPMLEIQGLRSEFGNMARQYAAQGNASMADIYGGMRDVIGRFLDNQEFQNPRTQEAYQAARNLSRLEAQLFKQPTEMKQTLARTPTGGDVVSSARTLDKFVRPGPAGRDTIMQVLNVDRSNEMINLLGDYIVSKLPRGTQAARDFMRKYEPTLNELPAVRDRLQAVVDARAAADALRDSPISIFAGKEPRAAIKQLMSNPNRIEAIRRIKRFLQDRPGAWDGMKAAYVDEILSRIQSTIESGADGNPALKQGATTKFFRENQDLTREILGPVGEETLREVSEAVDMMNRTSRGGYPGGSDTATMLTGHRLLDNIIAKYLDVDKGSIGSMAAGYTAGAALAGPFAGVAGAFAGARAHNLFANARAQVQALLHDALLDPAKGRALMLKAKEDSLRAVPRSMRKQLQAYTDSANKKAARSAAAAALAVPPEGYRKHKDGKYYGPHPDKPGQYREWSPTPFE